jgi:hypothetical protein
MDSVGREIVARPIPENGEEWTWMTRRSGGLHPQSQSLMNECLKKPPVVDPNKLIGFGTRERARDRNNADARRIHTNEMFTGFDIAGKRAPPWHPRLLGWLIDRIVASRQGPEVRFSGRFHVAAGKRIQGMRNGPTLAIN